ncbi:hypothetical protein GIB67_032442 [Kingdonia uniflora]|uniref:protein-serine/threonine phosphatase n=1 Tax=Kingdonia uniflora TaxID=39325 RepID=A0A7J7LSS4_9MAGN|nr:hypothetical protein GIB67_032442 [Kingdonia uniflora]
MISMLSLLGLAQEPSDILLKPSDGYKMVLQDGQLLEDSVHDLARDLLNALHFPNLSQLSDMGYTLSIEGKDLNHHKVETFRPDRIQTFGDIFEPSGELSVSFGYNFCTSDHSSSYVPPTEFELSNGVQIPNSNMKTRTGSFSCLSGAALSANATLANTNICNGVIGEEILPGLDSPKSLRRLASSPSLSRLDLVSSSSISSMSTLGGSVSTENGLNEGGLSLLKTMSAPTKVESSSFLNAMDVQMAGFHLHLLEWRTKKLNDSSGSVNFDKEFPDESFCVGVLNCLSRALAQSESDFLHMVEHEMGEQPYLVSVGSCVLVALLHGKYLYVLNLGDSRAMLTTLENQELGLVKAIQLTETHSVDNEIEYKKSNMNDTLMGILRDFCNPLYVYTNPFTKSHQVSEKDQFVVLGSDGLYDFFNNEEVVQLVHSFIHSNPFEDHAKYLVENKLLETQGSSRSVGESTDSGSAHNTLLELESSTSKRASNQSLEQKQQQLLVEMASDNTSITGPVQIQHFSTPEKVKFAMPTSQLNDQFLKPMIVYVSDDEVYDNQSPVIGLAYLPSAICISTMGRHVSYDQIIAWNVLNNENNIHCIAFAFINWSFV